jgi:hypothetical protein
MNDATTTSTANWNIKRTCCEVECTDEETEQDIKNCFLYFVSFSSHWNETYADSEHTIILYFGVDCKLKALR